MFFFGTFFYVKQWVIEETLTKPNLSFVGLVMFFNWVNLDAKLRVAILGRDFDCVVALFSISHPFVIEPTLLEPGGQVFLFYFPALQIFISNDIVYEATCRDDI